MRDQITINRKTYTVSSTGQRDGSGMEVGTYFAEIKQSRNDQDMIGNFNTIEEIWEFKIRNQTNHGTTFEKKDYIVWSGDTYQIMGLSDQSKKNRFVVFKAARVR